MPTLARSSLARALAAVLAFGLVAAACGDSDDSDASSSESSSASASASSSAPAEDGSRSDPPPRTGRRKARDVGPMDPVGSVSNR